MNSKSALFIFFNDLLSSLVASESQKPPIARRLRVKFWPDCAIPDTSMEFGTVVDHD